MIRFILSWLNGLLPPDLYLRPSVFLRLGLVSLHGLAAVALLYTDLSLAGGVILTVMLVGSLVGQWYYYGTVYSPGFVIQLRACHDGYWQLVYADGTMRKRVLKRYYIHSRLLILQFRTQVPGLNSTLVIMADATDPERLRQLRCHLLRLAWRAET